MTDEEKVRWKWPDADIGIGCDRYRAWFRVIRASEKPTFWKGQKVYGTGRTVNEAWADAARRLEEELCKN